MKARVVFEIEFDDPDDGNPVSDQDLLQSAAEAVASNFRTALFRDLALPDDIVVSNYTVYLGVDQGEI